MPFITEELWQALYERQAGASIMSDKLEMEAATAADKSILEEMEVVKQIISGVRTIRSQRNIPPKTALELHEINSSTAVFNLELIAKLANISRFETTLQKGAAEVGFMVGTKEFSVPLTDTIDVDEEIKKLTAQIEHLEGFLTSVKKKLSNERFVANAPEAVVAMERKKQADAEEKIQALRDSIAALK